MSYQYLVPIGPLPSTYNDSGLNEQVIALGNLVSEPTEATSDNVNLTGQSGTGSVGTFTKEVDITLTLGGVQGTSNIGTFVNEVDTNISLVGIQAFGDIGTFTIPPTAHYQYLVSIGPQPSLYNDSLLTLQPTSSAVLVNEAQSNTGPVVTFNLTGRSGTGSVGSFTETNAFPITGVQGTSAVGAFNVNNDINVNLVGVQGTGNIGAFNIFVGALGSSSSLLLLGVSGPQSGSSTVINTNFPLSTVSGTVFGSGSVGAFTRSVIPNITLAGVQGTGSVGVFNPSPQKMVNLTGVAGTGSIGTLTANSDNIFDMTGLGVEGDSSVGTFAITGVETDVFLTGVQGTGSVGIPAVSIPGGAVITTFQLSNETGSSETPMHSVMFGHGFVDSDAQGMALSGGLPTYPIFKINGVTMPYTMAAPTYWPVSGRLMIAGFVLLLGGNVTIPNGGTVTVSVYNGGTKPGPSSRTTADLTAGGLNLQHIVTGLDNLSGDWVSNLATGITNSKFDGNTGPNGDDYVWADGAAGKMWRIRQSYTQGGTPQGTLEGYWYVMSMQDNLGNFAGVRYMHRAALPWLDVIPQANKHFMSFTKFAVQNGATVIRDMVTQRQNSVTFVRNGGAYIQATATIETAQLVRATTTGTLPNGLALNTSYWMDAGNAQTSITTGFSLSTNSTSAANNSGNFVPSTTNGTGTHTLTAYPYVSYYASMANAGTSAKYDYIQGAGSVVTDAVSRIVFDRNYLRLTQIWPAYNYNVTPPVQPDFNYYANTSGGFQHQVGGTGERGEIGIIHCWGGTWLYLQDAISEKQTRAIGLIGLNVSSCARTQSTGGRLTAFNNGHNMYTTGNGAPYTGVDWSGAAVTMGPLQPWNFWTYSNSLFGIAENNVQITTCAWDFTHQPSLMNYAYCMTGEPQYMDGILEYAQTQLSQQAGAYSPPAFNGVISTAEYQPRGGLTKNEKLNGLIYYMVFMLTGTVRGDAWNLRDIGGAAALCPQAHPEHSAYKQYFSDVVGDNAKFLASMISTPPTPWAANAGLYYAPTQSQTSEIDPWMSAYVVQAMAYIYGLTQDANWLLALNKLCQWWCYATNATSPYLVASEEFTNRKSQFPGPLIDSDLLLGTHFPSLTWPNDGTGNFNMTIPNSGGASAYHAQVGDVYIFDGPLNLSGQSHLGPIPAAFTAFTPYYCVSITGAFPGPYVMKLSATPSGTPIINTDASTNTISLYCRPAVYPGPITTMSANSTTGYLSNLYGSMKLAMSRGGITDPTAMAALLSYRLSDASYGQAGSSIKYFFNSSLTANDPPH